MGVRRRPAGSSCGSTRSSATASGTAHELAPELVHVDEWGYPIIVTDPTPSAPRRPRVRRYAVRGCPRQALRVERVAERLSADRRFVDPSGAT